MPQILLFILSGLAAGVLSGMFGVGGGIILIPAFIYIIGLDPHAASGTSLVALLLPVGLLGVLQYYKAGKINADNIKMGLIVALGLFIGAYFGARISTQMPAELLKKSFAFVLVLAAFRLWFS